MLTINIRPESYLKVRLEIHVRHANDSNLAFQINFFRAAILKNRNIGKHDVDLAHADLICQIFKIRIDGQI